MLNNGPRVSSVWRYIMTCELVKRGKGLEPCCLSIFFFMALPLSQLVDIHFIRRFAGGEPCSLGLSPPPQRDVLQDQT